MDTPLNPCTGIYMNFATFLTLFVFLNFFQNSIFLYVCCRYHRSGRCVNSMIQNAWNEFYVKSMNFHPSQENPMKSLVALNPTQNINSLLKSIALRLKLIPKFVSVSTYLITIVNSVFEILFLTKHCSHGKKI